MRKKKEEKQDQEQESDAKMENLQIDDSQIDDGQSSQDSWWSSWSGLSQKFTNSLKGEKRNWAELNCDEEEEKWWSSFKSTQKSSQKSSSSQKESEIDKEDNQAQECASGGDENNNDDDDVKLEFYLKCGRYNKLKFCWSFFYFSDKDNVYRDRIHHYFYNYFIIILIWNKRNQRKL